MSKLITTRSELLFCYDVTDANPNGDPMDENKPRIDEESGVNFVTDVRLKRTIRDYLREYKGYDGSQNNDIYVREKESKKGGIQDGKERAGDFGNSAEEILKRCIDIRLFGGVLPLEGDSITFTGPVQFKIGRSLHKVELTHVQGTGAFAATAGKKQQTFREEYILHYSFIAFHGIINQVAARHTSMTDDDVSLLLESMWLGTRNLISRSKFGQAPRLLLKIDYKLPYFYIGDLDKKIKMVATNELKVRSLADFTLDTSPLLQACEIHADKIADIHFMADSDLSVKPELPSSWKAMSIGNFLKTGTKK